MTDPQTIASKLTAEEWHTTGEVARMCGRPTRTVRRWVERGDIPDGPCGISGQGRGNELRWSPDAVEQALARAKEHRGHDYNRPGMTRGRGHRVRTHLEKESKK